jgi:hypothetical protein
MNLLDLDQLTELVESASRDMFRIETLAAYATPITSREYRRWLDGEPEPDWEARQPWLDTLTRWTAEGRHRRRVRVIHEPISDYERYACDWSYPSSVNAGEQVRVLDLNEVGVPKELLDAPGDWSLLDNSTVIRMRYGPEGQFAGAQVLDADHLAQHQIAAVAVWNAAEPFQRWWPKHPQYRRRVGLPAR